MVDSWALPLRFTGIFLTIDKLGEESEISSGPKVFLALDECVVVWHRAPFDFFRVCR